MTSKTSCAHATSRNDNERTKSTSGTWRRSSRLSPLSWPWLFSDPHPCMPQICTEPSLSSLRGQHQPWSTSKGINNESPAQKREHTCTGALGRGCLSACCIEDSRCRCHAFGDWSNTSHLLGLTSEALDTREDEWCTAVASAILTAMHAWQSETCRKRRSRLGRLADTQAWLCATCVMSSAREKVKDVTQCNTRTQTPCGVCGGWGGVVVVLTFHTRKTRQRSTGATSRDESHPGSAADLHVVPL